MQARSAAGVWLPAVAPTEIGMPALVLREFSMHAVTHWEFSCPRWRPWILMPGGTHENFPFVVSSAFSSTGMAWACLATEGADECSNFRCCAVVSAPSGFFPSACALRGSLAVALVAFEPLGSYGAGHRKRKQQAVAGATKVSSSDPRTAP